MRVVLAIVALLALTCLPVPAAAQPLDEAAVNRILARYSTDQIARCLDERQVSAMSESELETVCGGAITRLEIARGSLVDPDPGTLGVIDWLDSILYSNIADRFIQIDGGQSKSSCRAFGKRWKLLSRIQYAAFDDSLANYLKERRDEATKVALKCLGFYPGLF